VTAPNFSTQLFLNGSLDDIAPLSGSGSRNVPDGGIGLIPVSLAFASLLVAHSRKRKAA
jgi:hypothetical protein